MSNVSVVLPNEIVDLIASFVQKKDSEMKSPVAELLKVDPLDGNFVISYTYSRRNLVRCRIEYSNNFHKSRNCILRELHTEYIKTYTMSYLKTNDITDNDRIIDTLVEHFVQENIALCRCEIENLINKTIDTKQKSNVSALLPQ